MSELVPEASAGPGAESCVAGLPVGVESDDVEGSGGESVLEADLGQCAVAGPAEAGDVEGLVDGALDPSAECVLVLPGLRVLLSSRSGQGLVEFLRPEAADAGATRGGGALVLDGACVAVGAGSSANTSPSRSGARIANVPWGIAAERQPRSEPGSLAAPSAATTSAPPPAAHEAAKATEAVMPHPRRSLSQIAQQSQRCGQRLGRPRTIPLGRLANVSLGRASAFLQRPLTH